MGAAGTKNSHTLSLLERPRQLASHEALSDAASALAHAHNALNTAHPRSLDQLEEAVDALWRDYLDKLHEIARSLGPLGQIELADRWVRTGWEEFMDRPDFPDEERVRALEKLHSLNLSLGTYDFSFDLIQPVLELAARTYNRTPRLLDVASGSGGFPIAVARLVRAKGLPLYVVGSDIQPALVDRATERAQQAGVDVPFRVIDASEIKLDSGSFDVVTILQAAHHLTPGRLARVIFEAVKVATIAFVAIDGIRAPWLSPLAAIGTMASSGNPWLAHDAFVSALRMYDRTELTLIARAACPRSVVQCTEPFPTVNMLQVYAMGVEPAHLT